MRKLLQYLITIFYLVVFIFFFSKSIRSFLERRKIFMIDTTPISEFQHPSVSICPKYTFKKTPFTHKLLSNLSNAEKKAVADNNRWSKKEVFYFVNHPGMLSMTYPCLTLIDGADPGKPCSFPFRYLFFITDNNGSMVVVRE